MSKEDINRILYISAGLIFLALFILSLIGIKIFSIDGLKKIPSIVSGIVVFWTFYFKFGWKFPIVKKLVYKENLNGTWFGTYKSKDFDTNNEYEGELAIVIRQSFLNLNIKSFTDKYLNYSFGERLNYDPKSESHQLIYLYSQSQFNPTDDKHRKGTSELQLLCEPDKDKLFGDFWTNHNSKGNLNLYRISKKHFKSFQEAKNSSNI